MTREDKATSSSSAEEFEEAARDTGLQAIYADLTWEEEENNL